jgi:uncharacterized protein (DUF849 family)
VINISTGGSADHVARTPGWRRYAFKPEVCSLNMGPMIFGFSAAGARSSSGSIRGSASYVESKRVAGSCTTTTRYIERIMREIGQGHGTRFEFECYDIGHLYTLKHFADRG